MCRSGDKRPTSGGGDWRRLETIDKCLSHKGDFYHTTVSSHHHILKPGWIYDIEDIYLLQHCHQEMREDIIQSVLML